MMVSGRRITLGLAVLAALPLLYAGAYMLLAQRAMSNPGGVWVEYRIGGDFAKGFFAPAHRLDKHLRQKHWDHWASHDDVQYFPPGPEFPLSNEAAQKAYNTEEQPRLR